ncbi:MAG: polysaccharide export protein [Gammaproteobacteria bacterium]
MTGCASNEIATLPPASYQNSAFPYILAPGDELEIFVWGNPQLSTEVTVRPDGKITTPLVEDIQASGKTPNELAREMETLLAQYVLEPVVSVKVSEFVGRYSEQIRIIGQAAKPQSLPYRESITAMDVMIAVGGMTEFADGNRATIVRTVDGKQEKYNIRLDDLINKGDISANVDMLPGDVLIIPEAWF